MDNERVKGGLRKATGTIKEKAGQVTGDRDMEAEGLSLPVVEATCRYVAPARYEDVLLVGIEVPAVTRVTVTFRYEVTREGAPGVVLCTGTTVHACLGKGGRPARLPEWVASLR